MSVDEAFRRLMDNDEVALLAPHRGASAPAEIAVETTGADEASAARPETAIPLELERVPVVQRFAYHPVDNRSQIAEEYRILRTRLLSLEWAKPSILITSCHHNEGKSSTALNLALCMARRRGVRILLVDFDLRRPRLHKMLGLGKRRHDVGSLLDGKCEPEDAIVHSRDDNLYVLAAAREYSDGTEMLEGARTRELMERLHATFDFVVVDACPCLSTSDPAILGRYTGGTMLIVRCLQTQRESIEHAVNILEDMGTKVVGVVLTFMRYFIPRYLYRYQYYHGYYYYRGYGGEAGAEKRGEAAAEEPAPAAPDAGAGGDADTGPSATGT